MTLENKTEVGSRLKKHSYGKYLLIFVVLASLFKIVLGNVEPRLLYISFASAFSFLSFASALSFLRILLDFSVLYFFVFWIIDLIRHRGGVDRPENKKVRLVVNIIFGIFLLLAASYFCLVIFIWS